MGSGILSVRYLSDISAATADNCPAVAAGIEETVVMSKLSCGNYYPTDSNTAEGYVPEPCQNCNVKNKPCRCYQSPT